MRRLALAAALAALAMPALAQGNLSPGAPPSSASLPNPAPGFAPTATSTAPAAISPAYQQTLGGALPIDKGPWVLGEVLFFSNGKAVVSDTANITWRDRVRGTAGSLYTQADIMSDVDSLMALGVFQTIQPSVYEISGMPVPPDFTSVAVDTNEVRLVFNVVQKPSLTASSTTVHRPLPAASVSGLILTPTAYRGTGNHNTPGLGLDINAVYIIGRLYGRNNFANAPASTNYLDRVGIWMLQGDGKMQLQSEGTIRPAVATGFQGTFLFRDSGQPAVNNPNPTVTVNASESSTQELADAYFVMSKKFGPVRASGGIMTGNEGQAVAQFSEFLSPDALRYYANEPGQTFISHTQSFGSLMMLPKPQYPLGVEFIKYNGGALSPTLINFKVGYFLHLNFDVGLLKFQGGYDLLGLLQYRFTEFPR